MKKYKKKKKKRRKRRRKKRIRRRFRSSHSGSLHQFSTLIHSSNTNAV
jgi:hypothetical protein